MRSLSIKKLRTGLSVAFIATIGAAVIEQADAQTVIGEPETVVKASDFKCKGDRSDIPANAFQRDDGTVVLIAGNRKNIVSVGKSLDRVSRQKCRSLMVGNANPDPSQFDDQKWVTQLYSFNGKDVTAFVHHEYHGEHHGEKCKIRPIGDRECWYASTVKAVSSDGGRTFRSPNLKEKIIIAPPSKYVTRKRRVGTFMPKVVGDQTGNFVYVLVSSVDRNKGLRIGQCLLRSTDQKMKQWELWTGRNWRKAKDNPYDPNFAGRKNCRPVLAGNVLSLRYVPEFNQYVTLGATRKSVYLSYSDDMVNWGPRRVLRGISPRGRGTRRGKKRQFPHKRWYFSLLDPASRSRNFDTVSPEPYLYYVEFGGKRDQSIRVRTLKRVRISLDG